MNNYSTLIKCEYKKRHVFILTQWKWGSHKERGITIVIDLKYKKLKTLAEFVYQAFPGQVITSV